MKRSKVRASRPMSDRARRRVREARERKRRKDEERRLAQIAATHRQQAEGTWRHRKLRRYVDAALAVEGADRIEFFERHPVAELFR